MDETLLNADLKQSIEQECVELVLLGIDTSRSFCAESVEK